MALQTGEASYKWFYRTAKRHPLVCKAFAKDFNSGMFSDECYRDSKLIPV